MDKEPSVILRNKKDSKRIRQCRVVFSYKQDHEDELNLNVGDIIEVLGEEEEGWWRGILNGKIGVFPSNFVEEIFDKLKSSKENLHSPHENEVIPSSKPAKILCEVKYSYKAQNEDELNMKEGDIITLLSKDGQDPGWWKGELNGVVGVFPDNFVIILPHNNNISDRNSNEKLPNADFSHIKPSSVASQRKSLDSNKVQNSANNIEKSELNHSENNKVTPPVPSKKPAIIGIKKSPSSGSGTGSGLFFGIKKKIADAVDGATSSKTKTSENNENIFDQVERVPLLVDVRATRAKAPAGRRPPSVVFREEESGIPNGNSVEPLNLEVVTEQSSITDTDCAEIKPKLREWEKHKAPWLAEMKLNQAKRTSPSPVQPPSTDSKPKTPETEENKQKTPETETVQNSISKNNSTPLTSKPKEANEKVPLRPKPNLTNIPAPRPSSIQQQPPSPVVDIPQKPTKVTTSPPSIKPEKNLENDVTISFKQYTELVERIHKLELLVEKQNTLHTAAIDELKGKLQLETQIRQMLQVQLEKINSQNVMQV